MGRAPASADERFMAEALRLAARARGRTSPNPLVGSVIVKGGEVVGRGYHRRAGTEHGEVAAIGDAGERAQGADLYVNLEPCNHRGRTGPCARAIVEAGVARVVVGMKDPNPLVNGKGIRALRRKGISVVTGVLERQSRELNAAFLRYIDAGLPLVTLKAALTLDGRVACRGGDAKWVTGPEALRAGHRMRDRNDAIIHSDDLIVVHRGRSSRIFGERSGSRAHLVRLLSLATETAGFLNRSDVRPFHIELQVFRIDRGFSP